MKISASVICLIFALVCFLFAAFQIPAKVSWRDLGFACVTLAFLFY